MRLEHLLSGDGRLSLSFEREEIRKVRKDRKDVVSQDKSKKENARSSRKRQQDDTNLAKVTLYRADVALQTVSMGREVEVLNFSL